MAEILLKIRDSSTGAWITNFSNLGWKVRNSTNTGWITMTPDNTQVRNAADSGWLRAK